MKLSVIIVSFNTQKLIENCIESIQANFNELNYEIIVVDNGSTDQSTPYLTKLQKQKIAYVIFNKQNVGFAKANNQGIQKAKGEYVLLLNSDTIVNDNNIVNMLVWLKDHEDVGVVSCALKNLDGTLQRNGGSFPTLFTVFCWMFFIEDFPFVDTFIPTFHPRPRKIASEQDWVTGAFMLMPKKAIEEAGLMPEDYFMYTEDVDFCYQFKQKQWKVWYLPQWSITHLGGQSSKPGEGIVKEFSTIKIFWKKNYPAWQMPVLKFLLRAGSFLRLVAFGILRGKESGEIYAKSFKQI